MTVNKRIVSILLVFSLLLTMVACGEEESIGYQNANAVKQIDFTEEPVTITYLTIGDKPTNGRTEEVVAKLNTILEKRLNARLDIYYVGWDDYLQNYNKTLESKGVSVDLIGTGTDWLDAWPNVINGSFMPLSEDMLRNYCAVTYTNVSQNLWNSCKYNGDIYFIPENEYTQWTNHGFIYRVDIAKEAGLSQIDSWEDMTTYFKCVIENHPGMVPWDISGDSEITALGYLMSSMKYLPIYELTTYGLWGEDADNRGKIISPYYKGNELIEFARLMKEWNRMGVWKGDSTMVGDNDAEFYSGDSSVIQHHTQNFYTEIKPNMAVTNPDVELDFYWFGKDVGNLMRVSNLHGAMAISATSKNPERALMVYDMLRNDEECYRLIRYGIEGIQYNVTDAGMLEKPSGYNETKDSMVTNFWWGRRDEYEIPDSSYAWDEYYELVNSYEHVAVPYPWEGIPFSTPAINAELKEIISICDKYIPLICSGKYTESPEVIVDSFREELMKAGFERITGQLQRIYNAQ